MSISFGMGPVARSAPFPSPRVAIWSPMSSDQGSARLEVKWSQVESSGVNCDVICHIMSCWIITSSTALGGGGSFKNRKPIGEVGCCESRMAERSH